MFNVLTHAGDLHVWKRVKITGESTYTLGVEQIGNKILSNQNDTIGGMTWHYSSSVLVSSSGDISLVNEETITVNQNTVANGQNLVGKFAYPEKIGSGFSAGAVVFFPSNAVVTYTNRWTQISKYQSVTVVPPGTSIDYPVHPNHNAYQEGDNAKPAGYTLGEIQNGQFALIGSNVGLSYQYGDIKVSDGGSLSIEGTVTLTVRPATTVSQLNVMRGKFVRASGSTALGDFPKNQVFYIPEDAVFEVYDTGSGYNGSRVNKRQVVTGYPAIPANVTIEYLGQLGNKMRIETGSYVGTGKYGKNNPNTLTFGFEPKFVIIGMDRGGIYIDFYFWGNIGLSGANNYASENIVSISNHTMSWYHPSDVSGQLNSSGREYRYIAIY